MSSKPVIPLAYASPSLGMHPTHTLQRKIAAISAAGYAGIELAFDDLVSFARAYLHNPTITATSYPQLVTAAQKIRLICAPHNHNLSIFVLQAFSNFDGYPAGSEKRADAWERAKGWRDIMDALGCHMLQVGSNDDPESSGDLYVIAKDLAELADFMKPRKVAYENWCWGAHVRTWKDTWAVVKKADKENLGLCLDTFQTVGGEWGDPTTASGKIEREGLDRDYRESMHQLASTIPKEKIFFFQISDALKPKEPLQGGYKARGDWSHAFRPPPYMGGYLPVEDMVRAVLKTGFRGWFSMEVFLEEEHGKEWEEGLEEKWAGDAMQSMRRLLKECGA
ncbi:3-dehydroshikimate dehydratase [Sphaerosporella brunnea]|uniref:3-dehydroshikimate dehydratase n=1 Tax=Sphaerosporella brunnea TaxID=1250544 RepID=A0A5J5EME5_9PEZI|nr:3-dehydroshikimate dehydratase [Sphaerosporella brunnea]